MIADQCTPPAKRTFIGVTYGCRRDNGIANRRLDWRETMTVGDVQLKFINPGEASAHFIVAPIFDWLGNFIAAPPDYVIPADKTRETPNEWLIFEPTDKPEYLVQILMSTMIIYN